jgi:hypothetical protein
MVLFLQDKIGGGRDRVVVDARALATPTSAPLEIDPIDA